MDLTRADVTVLESGKRWSTDNTTVTTLCIYTPQHLINTIIRWKDWCRRTMSIRTTRHCWEGWPSIADLRLKGGCKTRDTSIHIRGSMQSDQSSPASPSSNEEHIHTLPYQAGDVASILPCNPPAMVERFLSVLPVPIRSMADDVIRIQQNSHQSLNHSWPQMCTSRGLLTHCGIFKLCPREKTSSLSVPIRVIPRDKSNVTN